MMLIKSHVKTIAVGVLTAAITAFYVIDTQGQRAYPSIDLVESQTSEVQKKIAQANNETNLPSLPLVWRSIETIAAAYGVKVQTLNVSKSSGVTENDIPGGSPWFGVLQGKTKNVAIAAIKIQDAVPVLFGTAAIDNDLTGLGFAALGSKVERAK